MDDLEEIKNQVKDLTNALQRLTEALDAEKTDLNRDASIQRFEFCFEIIWKTLKNINASLGRPCASPRDCLRIAAQTNLLDNPETWFKYLEARNLASHTYDEAQAEKVYEKAKEFLPEAQKVLEAVRIKLELKPIHIPQKGDDRQ